MDSITQAALGAAIGDVFLRKETGRKGALAGALIATIPDLDVILLPFYTPLQRVSIHRGYSHSILFSILGALLLLILLGKMKGFRDVRKPLLLLTCWMLLITHMLLDAFTSYGTQLFLPINDYRVSFDSIGIIDPVYTFPLLVGLVLSLFLFRRNTNAVVYSKIGLLVSTLYLCSTLAVKSWVEGRITSELADRNIEYRDLLSIPVGAGSMNWYGVARSDSTLYIGTLNVWNEQPPDFEAFAINDHLLDGLDPYLVDRMKWFAQGFYTVAESDGTIRLYNLQCDMQGTRSFGGYRAPTAFYFEITPYSDGGYALRSGMH